MGARPVLVAAGTARPRNYADNTFPFRASSHFLYLFGWAIPGGFGLWDGTSWTLFARPPTADDALWHGPEPALEDLGAQLGCAVRPLDGLAATLARLPAAAVATLPTPDLETCSEAQALLGRPVRPGHLAPVDEPLADAMIALRLVQDDAAVAELRAASVATAAAHQAGMRATRPGGLEAGVRAAMESELAARGMTVAYNSIVTVHGEVLHNNHYHHRLEANDLLLADVGAETPGGWAGDVTRTWPVSGRFSSTQREMYEVVLRAQLATIAAVKPGVRYRDLHLLAARRLTEGLVDLGILAGDPQELVADGVTALLFPHGVGHLLGLDVHDMEDLGDRAGYAPGRQRAAEFGLRYLRLDRDLVAGMAVTIEPGLYVVPAILEDAELGRRAQGRLRRDRLAAFSDVRGIRIEDDVLVTATGAEVLTAAIPKTPAAVETAMQ
jgi:Xaa-Pro aminopeptidase